MQSSGTVPDVGVPADDLRRLVERPGPFVSVVLGTEGRVQNAAQGVERRWQALRQQLEGAGAPAAALEAVDALVPDAHLAADGLVVLADHTGALVTERLDEPPTADRVTAGAVPDLVPVLAARQHRVPHIVVLADRGGADVFGVTRGGRLTTLTAGDGEPERKVAGGGWSHRRFQQRAEDDWAHQAREVVQELVRLARDLQPRVIVLGGDVRAVQLIRDDLPGELVERTHVIDPGRADDGSEAARREQVRRLVQTAVAEDTVAALEVFREEHGQEDRAVAGPQPTIDALAQSAVGLLLVHDTDLPARVGDDPLSIELDGSDGAPVRLVDALVRAALVTGAGVRVVPAAGPVPDGIGAILRWHPGPA